MSVRTRPDVTYVKIGIAYDGNEYRYIEFPPKEDGPRDQVFISKGWSHSISEKNETNNLKIHFSEESYLDGRVTIEFSYKGVTLDKLNFPRWREAVDTLNMYHNMSESELADLRDKKKK